MRSLLLLGLLVGSMVSFAEEKQDNKKVEWNNTTLSDATIKKIQEIKYKYNKCVVTEMRKVEYIKADSRHATDAIMLSCEPVLGDIRKVYLEEKVPDVIADRHLKQIRTQTTRGVLQQMILNEAARKANAPQIPAPAAEK
jgi:hypothetical protein